MPELASDGRRPASRQHDCLSEQNFPHQTVRCLASEFSLGNRFNHEPKRPRKLLLHQREIEKLLGAVERKGMTLVPLSVYFNLRGRAKVELALAKGKQTHAKRSTIRIAVQKAPSVPCQHWTSFV